MQVSIIRGYKLILWGNRLDFIDTSMIDPKGINYIYQVTPVDDMQSRVILLLQTRDHKPLATTFIIDNFTFNTLMERFEVEE